MNDGDDDDDDRRRRARLRNLRDHPHFQLKNRYRIHLMSLHRLYI